MRPSVMILSLLLFTPAFAGCAGDTASESRDGTSTSIPATPENAVDITMEFTPSSLTVSVGDTVTWTNKHTMTHTATADNGTFDSGNLAPGETFSFTFDTAGTYTYKCNIHLSMTGTIIVE